MRMASQSHTRRVPERIRRRRGTFAEPSAPIGSSVSLGLGKLIRRHEAGDSGKVHAIGVVKLVDHDRYALQCGSTPLDESASSEGLTATFDPVIDKQYAVARLQRS